MKKELININNLSDYLKWKKSNPDISLLDYVCDNLSPDMAISITKLFYPDFVLHDGKVLLKDRLEKTNYEEWKKKLSNDQIKIEKMINHIHLQEDLFLGMKNRLDFKNLKYLANILVSCWTKAVADQVPGRKIKVELYEDKEAEDIILNVYQESQENGK